ncbi:MAG: hypothetical protein ABI778_10230, partial [Ignavibacteriota bacterium]
TVDGGHITYTPIAEKYLLQFGATAYTLTYDKEVYRTDSLSIAFRGQRQTMASIDMHTGISIFSASVEFARMIGDFHSSNALTANLLAAPLPSWEITLNYRNLPQDFVSPFGGTFGLNSSDAQNERGWYLASKMEAIADRLWIYGAANFSTSKNNLRSDVRYTDIIFGSEYHPVSLPVQLILTGRNYSRGPAFTLSDDSLSKRSLRIDMKSEISKTIHLVLRSELQRTYSVTKNVSEGGYLAGLKLRYAPVKGLSVAGGIAYYSTDSYASRFYSNESDLPGSVPFVALYGKGYRYYLVAGYNFLDAATLSARIAESRYAPNSSTAEVQKTIVGMQIDMGF